MLVHCRTECCVVVCWNQVSPTRVHSHSFGTLHPPTHSHECSPSTLNTSNTFCWRNTPPPQQQKMSFHHPNTNNAMQDAEHTERSYHYHVYNGEKWYVNLKPTQPRAKTQHASEPAARAARGETKKARVRGKVGWMSMIVRMCRRDAL